MNIREFKQTNIKSISNEDLRAILGTTFNKKIIEQIHKEFFEREVGK